MVFISTLNNISVISCRLVLLVEETGDSGLFDSKIMEIVVYYLP
jgi:hypothetical protein